MKNIIYLMILFTGLSACKKDRIVSYEIEKSFQDPTLKFEDFKKAIAAGTDGFQMIIESKSGSICGGYIKFDGAGNAKFVSDNNASNALTPKDTKYSLNVIQTNSVLGFGKSSSFGLFAAGLAADTSYSYKMSAGDTLKLVGNTSGTNLKLIKVAKKSGDDYLAGGMSTAMSKWPTLNTFKYYFKRFTVSGKTYDIVINSKLKYVTINSLVGTSFKRFTTSYVYSSNGITLLQQFVDGTLTVSNLSDLVVSANAGTGNAGTNPFTIANASTPLVYDTGAAAAFYAGGSTAIFSGIVSWVSYTGYTIEGVQDAYGVTTIPGFNYLSFTARYQPTYDRLGFTANLALQAYGPAIPTTIKPNGTIAFSNFGSFGTAAVAIRTIVTNVTNQTVDALGYYVIQSGPNQFDLVNVKDGTIWISFE
ncbi:MAG: DUF4302 domain-containing protein [Candidatus Pedobacter colombiensis]|uniref:DUF4302 domain-containing protein n=1 Tax=Candidatus Pedobacter colombiensis TaxID=3121371 RepID=A0AAJ5W9Z0_9SPHI|nr:DUF4302 domain-containing protein [Pedobacter sp.]WEK19017.1 MAG: DUF4302 domain-containing protein [Pedobacter sp.]